MQGGGRRPAPAEERLRGGRPAAALRKLPGPPPGAARGGGPDGRRRLAVRRGRTRRRTVRTVRRPRRLRRETRRALRVRLRPRPRRTPPCSRPPRRTGASASTTSAGTRPSARPRAGCGSRSPPPARCRWPRSRSAASPRARRATPATPAADRGRQQRDPGAHPGHGSRDAARTSGAAARARCSRRARARARSATPGRPDRGRPHRCCPGALPATGAGPGGRARADRARDGRCRRHVPSDTSAQRDPAAHPDRPGRRPRTSPPPASSPHPSPTRPPSPSRRPTATRPLTGPCVRGAGTWLNPGSRRLAAEDRSWTGRQRVNCRHRRRRRVAASCGESMDEGKPTKAKWWSRPRPQGVPERRTDAVPGDAGTTAPAEPTPTATSSCAAPEARTAAPAGRLRAEGS